ncbi:MAG: cellulase family glycosylhydrolase, partial [Chloroflexota bacterium]|nr:cellulase family glycosylhydrolase [Chloroflexota bacterium]
MSRRLLPRARRNAPPPPPTVAALLRLPILLILLIGVLGSAVALAYTDRLVNRGVVWGAAQTPIPAAAGNPLGVNLFLEKEADQDVRHTLRVARDGGFRWIRQGFPWNDLEIAGKGDFTDRRDKNAPPKSAWDKYDFIVDQAAAYGLTLVVRLDAPPDWARLCPVSHSAPAHNSDYADFVSAVVSRYRGKVRYFQIWNEPNLEGEWAGKLDGQCVRHPNAAEYSALLKAAYQAAHAANPDVVILMAPLAQTVETGPANLSDLLYLQGMYDAGAKPYFDVANVMAYGLGQGPDDRRAEPERINFARPVLTREIMTRNGDGGKAVWASEVGWMSLPPDWTGKPGIWGTVAEATQADYLVGAFQRARAEWPWMGPLFVWHLRDPTPLDREPQPYFGILNADWTARPAFTALQRYARRFPIADTGAGRADDPALTTAGSWQHAVLGGQPVYTATDPTASATLAFQGTGVDLLFVPGSEATRVQLTIDGAPPPGWPRDPTGQAVVFIPARGSAADRVQPDPTWPAPPGESALRVRVAAGLPFGPHTA